LLQRSRALSLTAEVAYVRGNLNSAQRLYREALAGTAEAIRRNPDDPQRLFDHAQNVFWIADIARQRGQLVEAEGGLREYKRLADRMVALAPDNMKWRMEQQSADTNLGVLLFEQRRFSEATAQFTRALRNIEALATADPSNADYQKALTESESWLADARESEGYLEQATELKEQHIALLHQLLGRTGDVEYRQKLVPAERYLGELYAFRGDIPQAVAHLRAAVSDSEALIALEPTNSRWRGFSARANLNLAQTLLLAGDKDEAARVADTACNAVTRLLATNANVQIWRASLRECWTIRARLAVASGNLQQATRGVERALDIAKTVQTTDPVEDKYAIAQDYRLLGDIRLRSADQPGARAAWESGLAALPSAVAEKPNEMAEYAMLLLRLGRRDEARQRTERLAAIGYRQHEI
jgi:tetratricopeptide (TPR) repeat protein